LVSLKEDNLVTFYHLIASGIWPDKRGGLLLEGPYKRWTTIEKGRLFHTFGAEYVFLMFCFCLLGSLNFYRAVVVIIVE
jgi:hypothetical protein